MVEPRLTPQSELILQKLQQEGHFTAEERERIMKALKVFESFGIVAKFIVQLASLITAAGIILSMWYKR